MPKQTFVNLPEEKRCLILDVAIDEFLEHDYETASVSRIVARAGIAKGSFYQYFEDKHDLYVHVLDVAALDKSAFLKSQAPPDAREGMYAYLAWLAETGLQYRLLHPRLEALTQKAAGSALPFQDEILQRMRRASTDYYRAVLGLGMLRGDVDRQIDANMAAALLGGAMESIERHVFEVLHLEAAGPELTLELSGEMRRLVAEGLKVLRYGLASG